jgi:hypothetical protein
MQGFDLVVRRAAMQNAEHLPSVELWWPHLDIPAKHWLVAHLEDPVPTWITTEISALSHVPDLPTDTEYTLSVRDREYIVTQSEFVD